jgi:osmotically-inducible protein OsmY
MSSSATVGADQSQNGLTDQTVRAEIQQRLADRNISGVTITVTQGVVVVDGTVVSAWAKNQACEEPRKIFGVTSVTCNISVARRSRDSVIAFEVESWILDYAFYTIYDSVDVAVKDGRVTLTGEVMADARARTIADIASRVTGVVEVNNLLRTIVASPKDDDIRYEVAGRVYSNPLFSYGKMPGPVHIIVENGRVTLTGWVPSEGDRQLAEMIASAVPGVVRVENRLKCLIDD